MSAAVRTDRLTKAYGDLVALAPLDLEIAEGERVAVVGHNGSGKSTLLRLAAGLLDASGGDVRVAGFASGSLEARAALSYIGDHPSFYDDLSVWEHLGYVARLHGVTEWEEQALALLQHLGIEHRRDDLPFRFSRGLRQKAAIALGFVRPFEVVMVDEPFVGLDAAGKLAFVDLLQQAHQDGGTVVVATHEPAFLDEVDRLVALRDGEVSYDGPPGGVDLLSIVT
jgi:ABC-type multidrug transport system ATPase subunit